MKIVISVLMPVFNSKPYLASAIKSILSQSLQNWELLIADNGSTDGSLNIAQCIQIRDSRIRIIDGKGKSLSELRNSLLDHCKSDIVAWLDSDDIAEPERLAKHLAYFTANPDVVLAGSYVTVIGPDGLPIKCENPPGNHDDIINSIISLQSKGIFFPSSSARKSAILDVGGFRSEFNTAEDIDLFLRLSETGRIANIEEYLTRYRWRFQSLSWSSSARCHEGHIRAVQDFLSRRKLPPLDEVSIKFDIQGLSLASTWAAWSSQALQAGNLKTARRYAFRALRYDYLLASPWRNLALATFPIDPKSKQTSWARILRLPSSLIRAFLFSIALIIDRSK